MRDRDRDRDRDRSDSDRDRSVRSDRSHFSNNRRVTGGHGVQGSWGGGGGGGGGDVPDREQDWNRRSYPNRNGMSAGGNNREAKDKRGSYYEEKNYHRGGGGYRDREEEAEPEWFSGMKSNVSAAPKFVF
jgi:hypothetical protein